MADLNRGRLGLTLGDVDDDNPIEDEEMSDEVDEAEEEVAEPASKKARQTKARCWKYFSLVGPKKGNKQMAKCNGCNKRYTVDVKSGCTTTLNRHLGKCPKIQLEDIGQVVLDMHGNLKASKIDLKLAREYYAEAIIEHDQPYNFAEFRKFRRFHTYLNSEWSPICRNTMKQDCISFHGREKEKLRKTLANIPTRISLTSDLWTSINTEGYLCLTAHFIDMHWKLQSKILAFRSMPPPHNAFELSKTILDLLIEWGVEKKVFAITLDNASVNDAMVGRLKSQLNMGSGLLCDGDFLHVRCSAHILNLIIQDGVKVANEALSMVRESVKYIKGSEARMRKFKECAEQVGGVSTSVGCLLDVPTRWNATYDMLERAIKYKRVFASLQLVDRNYTECPTDEEWTRLGTLCRFLKPFCGITNLISGTSYPTSNLYFLQVWKIERILICMLCDEDVIVKSMARRMMDKFQKYWQDYSDLLSLGAVLDPRIKISTLSFCYEKIDFATRDQKVERIDANLRKLYEKYENTNPSISNLSREDNATSSSHGVTEEWDDEYIVELREHNQHLLVNTGKSELDIYLEEALLNIGIWSAFDTLQWWKDNSDRFPHLSLMARDLLSIPITTVASESAFSIGARVLNKYRNKLLSRNVEALICTRNWLTGFVPHDDDASDDDEANLNGTTLA